MEIPELTSENQSKAQKKLSLISFSGDFDKLGGDFHFGNRRCGQWATKVNIFFTFWGLDAIKKKQGRAFCRKRFSG